MRTFRACIGLLGLLYPPFYVALAQPAGPPPRLFTLGVDGMEPEVTKWIKHEREQKHGRTGKPFNVRVEAIKVDAKILQNESNLRKSFPISVQLFDDKNRYTCVLEKGSKQGEGEKAIWTWSGYLKEDAEGSVTFTAQGQSVTGQIRAFDATYGIRPAPFPPKKGAADRIHILYQVNPSAFPASSPSPQSFGKKDDPDKKKE